MAFNRVVFSSVKSDWRTPKKFYDELNKEFNSDFDPCPSNPTFDGLNIEWGKRNFVNPPYGNQTKLWLKKGVEEWKKGKLVVFLIPSRTGNKWFHDYVMQATEIRFIKGRLKFEGADNSAPFDSCIAVFKPKL